MLLTRYAPFRRSPSPIAGYAAPRLACVKPAASVHPEPGSNSSLYIFFIMFARPATLLFIPFSELTLYSLLYYLNCTSSFNMSMSFSLSPFSSERGCKDKGFIFSSPNIPANIFTFPHLFLLFHTKSARKFSQK